MKDDIGIQSRFDEDEDVQENLYKSGWPAPDSLFNGKPYADHAEKRSNSFNPGHIQL